MIVADTSGLLALFNRREPQHQAVRDALAERPDTLVVSPYVVAELDYLVASRLGIDAELLVLTELASGAYERPDLTTAELAAAVAVIDRYRDQSVGVADASLVVLADRFGTAEILTLDRRHFSVLRPLSGGRFDLIPRG